MSTSTKLKHMAAIASDFDFDRAFLEGHQLLNELHADTLRFLKELNTDNYGRLQSSWEKLADQLENILDCAEARLPIDDSVDNGGVPVKAKKQRKPKEPKEPKDSGAGQGQPKEKAPRKRKSKSPEIEAVLPIIVESAASE